MILLLKCLQKYKKNIEYSIVKHRFVQYYSDLEVKIIRNNTELTTVLKQVKAEYSNSTIGFVPTMGALHEGHISLIDATKSKCNIVICSIFVNPTQFNEQSDLDKYPRTIDADLKLLASNGCDIVYVPSETDIYPEKNMDYSIDLNGLDQVMEGQYRDHHFEGVCMVVERLFSLIQPHIAFFGIKDFQQVAIIKHLVKIRGFNIDIVACPIKREASGLAMSSRNSLLSEEEKKEAVKISQALFSGVESFKNGGTKNEILDCIHHILDSSQLKVEYIEIVDNDTLQPVDFVNQNSSVCIAAYCGSVRLIDNCQFY